MAELTRLSDCDDDDSRYKITFVGFVVVVLIEESKRRRGCECAPVARHKRPKVLASAPAQLCPGLAAPAQGPGSCDARFAVLGTLQWGSIAGGTACAEVSGE